jgi:rhodanese-related sulfurtransferase
MIRNNSYFVFTILLLLVIGNAPQVFGQETDSKSDKYLIEAENFKSSIEKKNAVVLDVRTPKEFDESHIIGAINIDYKNENFREEVQKLDKGKKYFIYCRSGKRSANSRKIMNELGIKKVYDLNGGIIAWKKQEYPIQ